jgi:hypothetical protein
MKKVALVSVLLLAMLTSVFAGGASETPAPAAAPKVIRRRVPGSESDAGLCGSQPAGHHRGENGIVLQGTGGETLRRFHHHRHPGFGVLGSENDVLDAILGGSTSIDISRISAFALTSYGAKKSMLLSVPFTFENRAHFWKFANSDLAPQFLNEPQELGLPIRGIFYGEEGFRHFFTKKPIAGINDLKGMKLRVSRIPS